MFTNEDLKKYFSAAECITRAISNGNVNVSWPAEEEPRLTNIIAKELMLIDRGGRGR